MAHALHMEEPDLTVDVVMFLNMIQRYRDGWPISFDEQINGRTFFCYCGRQRYALWSLRLRGESPNIREQWVKDLSSWVDNLRLPKEPAARIPMYLAYPISNFLRAGSIPDGSTSMANVVILWAQLPSPWDDNTKWTSRVLLHGESVVDRAQNPITWPALWNCVTKVFALKVGTSDDMIGASRITSMAWWKKLEGVEHFVFTDISNLEILGSKWPGPRFINYLAKQKQKDDHLLAGK